jgi:hypothetical protein
LTAKHLHAASAVLSPCFHKDCQVNPYMLYTSTMKSLELTLLRAVLLLQAPEKATQQVPLLLQFAVAALSLQLSSSCCNCNCTAKLPELILLRAAVLLPQSTLGHSLSTDTEAPKLPRLLHAPASTVVASKPQYACAVAGVNGLLNE